MANNTIIYYEGKIEEYKGVNIQSNINIAENTNILVIWDITVSGAFSCDITGIEVVQTKSMAECVCFRACICACFANWTRKYCNISP